MPSFSDSGWVVDAALAVMMVEAVALAAIGLARTAGHQWPPIDLFANLASGGLLLLALRSALTGGSAVVIAVLIFCSGIAHVAALSSRWRLSKVADR